MSIKISIAKFTSSPAGAGWAQVHDFTPQDPVKLELRGRLLAVITMQGEGMPKLPLQMVEVGREILSRLHEEYFGNLEASAFDRLVLSVNKVFQEFSEGSARVEIAALAILGAKVVIAGTAMSQAICARGGVVASVLDPKGGIPSSSGMIIPGDVFLVGSKNFFERFSQGVIKAAMTRPTPELIMESLNPGQTENGNMGAFVLKVENDTPIAVTRIDNFDEPKARPSQVEKYKQKAAGVVEKILQKLPKAKIVVGRDFRDLETSGSRKMAVTVGLMLLFILLASIFFGIYQKNLKSSKEKYMGRLTSAEHQLEEAKSLKDLNQARARELLIAAKSTAGDLQKEGIKDERIENLVKEIDLNIGDIAGIYSVDPELFLDLSLLSQGTRADDGSLSEGRLLILDKAGKLVSIDVAVKKTKVVAGPETIRNPLFVGVYADRNFVLNSEGIDEVEEDAKMVIEKDWTDAGGFHIYGGNAYVLDKGEDKIWRYTGPPAGGDAGFGQQKNWFAPGIEVTLSGVVSWAVDGSIWLLTSSGDVEKYVQGSPQDIDLTGIGGGLSGAKDIFADSETQYVYILDSQQGRVVVLEKDGTYKAEYIGEKIKDATKVVVSESNKKIILLAGSKLYSIEAKHL